MTDEEKENAKWLTANGLSSTFNKFIKRHDAVSRLTTSMGWVFQDEFKDKCEDMGLSCEEAPNGSVYDFIVDLRKVQCKSTGYTDRIDLRSKEKQARRYKLNDLDVFVIKIVGKNDHYIIPIADAKQIWDDKKVGYVKSGIQLVKIAEYKDAWHLL